MSCDHSYISLHCQRMKRKRKRKERKYQKKGNIKSGKIDKNKRKILVSKCIITHAGLHLCRYLLDTHKY